MNGKKVSLIMNITICSLVLLVFSIIIIVSMSAKATKVKSNAESDAKYFSSIYTNVPKENVYKKISAKNAISLVENGTGILYLGFKECPWCQAITPLLNIASKQSGHKTIYFIDNFYKMRPDKTENSENLSEYNKLLDLFDDIIPYEKDSNGNDTDQKIIKVPLVVFIQNGEIVGYHRGTYEGHELKTRIDSSGKEEKYLEELNDEQKQELIDIYKENIKKVYDNECNGSC